MIKEQDKAIERCNKLIETEHSNWIGITNQKAIETVLNMLKENSAEIHQKNTELAEKNAEIEKLNRQIDLIAEEINETDRGYTDYCEMKIECDRNCKDCIKQYFERKYKSRSNRKHIRQSRIVRR